MKIYVTHSSSFDYKNELYKPLRSSNLNDIHEITLPHEDSSSQFDSKNYLKKCDLVLAEVSYPSVGQGIELGWANLYKVPIVCFYKQGSKYSGALNVVSKDFIEYSSGIDLAEKLQKYLSN